MKTCSNCGAQYPDNDFSCPNCGLPEFLSGSVSDAVPEGIYGEDIYSPEYIPQEYPVFKKRRKGPSIYIVLSVLVILATSGIAVYVLLVTPSQKYKAAAAAFDAGDYKTAAASFEEIGGFKDSKDRAAESMMLMHYSNGRAAFNSGDFERAKAEFTAAGTYKDSADMAAESEKASHYAKALVLIASGDSDAAVEELLYAGDYKDSRNLIYNQFLTRGDRALGTGNYESAADYYVKASEYGPVTGKETFISYGHGIKALKEGNLEAAAEHFSKAGDYQDSAEQAKNCYLRLAENAVASNDLDNAAKYYAKTGLQTNDVNNKLKDYCYSAGVEAYKKKDYDSAADYLKTAGDYKDSKALLKECIYRQGIERLIAKEFDQGAALFRKCGKYKLAQELVKVCVAESYYANGSLNEALAAYSKVSPKTSISGFNIQGRKISIATERSLIKVSGEWTAKSNDAYIKIVRKRGKHKVKIKRSQKKLVGGQKLYFAYRENPDGTFDITIQATYFRYVSYSRSHTLSNQGVTSFEKTYFKVRKMPESFKINKYLTVRYSKGNFILSYAKNNKKKYKTDQYRATVKYRMVA